MADDGVVAEIVSNFMFAKPRSWHKTTTQDHLYSQVCCEFSTGNLHKLAQISYK